MKKHKGLLHIPKKTRNSCFLVLSKWEKNTNWSLRKLAPSVPAAS